MFQGCTELFMEELGESGSVLLVTNNNKEVKWQLVWNNNNNSDNTYRVPQASDQCLKQLSCC